MVGENGVGTLDLGGLIVVPPVAFDDIFIAIESGTITGLLPAGDVNGDSLIFSLIDLPTKGQVTLVNNTTGEFAYTADPDVTGEDSFTFKVNDGSADSNVATVTIKFAPSGILPAVAAGSYSRSLALRNDGTVLEWGGGSIHPKEVSDQTGGVFANVMEIDTGLESSLALKNDGSVWTWYGTGVLPVQVGDETGAGFLSDVISVAVGNQFQMVLKSDGSVWTWGINGSGELGNGTSIYSSLPVQVKDETGSGYLTDIIVVAANDLRQVSSIISH